MVHGLQPSNGTATYAQAFSDSWWSGTDDAAGNFVTDLTYFARVPNTQGDRYQVFPKALHDGAEAA